MTGSLDRQKGMAYACFRSTQMKNRNPRPTITDISERLGLSTSTVSRVINNEKHVSEETRSRVLAEMRRLGFAPDPYAQGLKTGRPKSVQLVVSEIDSRFIPTIMLGVEKHAYRNGYRVLLSGLDDERPKITRDPMAIGVIYAIDPVAGVDVKRLVRDPNTTVVCVYGFDTTGTYTSIIPDDRDGAAQVVAHLVSTGRRNIVHVRGQESFLATQSRIAGYAQAMAEAGLEGRMRVIGDHGYAPETGYRAVKQLLEERLLFDSVFAGNDEIAAGVYRAAHQLGLRIPDDVAVVGYDDTDCARLLDPTLTSVGMPMQEMGQSACQVLLSESGRDGPRPATGGIVSMKCKLRIRESTASGSVEQP